MKNLLKKTLMSCRGFGLVEVMVAAAMAGGLALVIAKISTDMNRGAKTAETNNEINNFVLDVGYILSNRDNCRHSIPNGTPYGTAVTEIAKDVTGTPQVVYQVGPTYGNGTFSIQSMVVRQNPTTTSPELSIQIQRENSYSYGARVLERNIPLQVVLDGSGNIDQCFSNIDLIISSAVQKACGDGNPSNNSSFYDPVTGACIHQTDDMVCPPGQFIYEVRTDTGRTVSTCRNTITTPASCPAGSHVTSIDSGGNASCAPIGTTNTCPIGQYAVRINNGAVECLPFPQCNPQSVLHANSTGILSCVDITCNTSNQYLAGFDGSGNPVCKTLTSTDCGPGNYVTKVNTDGSFECGQVPNHQLLPRVDYSFVDGFESGSWTRKSISQVAEQVCNRIVGFAWTGTTCMPAGGGSTPQEVCETFPGHVWTGTQCRSPAMSSGVSKLVVFKLKFNGGSSWTVSASKVLFSTNPNDSNVSVVIDQITRKNGARFNFRIQHNNYFIDSSEVISAQLIGPRGNVNDGNENMKLSITDISGSNEIELVKADDASDNDFIAGDIVNIIVMNPRL